MNKKMSGSRIEPDEKSLRLFFLGSYDLDSFRKFVFESRFLDIFDLDDEYREKIMNDEIELLKFGHRWLKYILYKEPTVALRQDSPS
jgi:hypothetical protein